MVLPENDFVLTIYPGIHETSWQYIVHENHFPTAPLIHSSFGYPACFESAVRTPCSEKSILFYPNRPNSPFFLAFADFLAAGRSSYLLLDWPRWYLTALYSR